ISRHLRTTDALRPRDFRGRAKRGRSGRPVDPEDQAYAPPTPGSSPPVHRDDRRGLSMAPEPQGHGRVVDSDLVTDSDGIVAVPERSSKEIDADVYRTLENSPDFLHLVESGVFSLVQTKRRKYAISAGPYVGEALLESGLRVRVTEKAVGSLASLVRWALPTDLRLTEAPAPIAPEGTALNVFVERFLDHIGGYLR